MKYLYIYFLLFSNFASGQYTLQGKVSNTKKENLSFATISLEGTNYSASTDENGRFTIYHITPGDYKLKVIFFGYKAYRLDLNISANMELDIILEGEIYNLDAIEIQSNRVSEFGPFTKQNLDKDQLQKENLGVDVPFLLQWTPSSVVTSDAGTGIGYTSLRIRGSDQTRINVTLNGVPVNDAESQNVFWVDMPDLIGSVNNVQIQRGVGTSTNGAGAFGGSVSINTSDIAINPYLNFSGSLGSFNTHKININVGTGLINGKFSIDGRYSSIKSDGYIDRASADLSSIFFSAARVSSKSSLRFNILTGNETTFQSWFGAPEAKVNSEANQLVNHYNNNLSTIYKTVSDSINLFSSDRRYNYYSYPNQVDNYRQTHVQLLHSLSINSHFKLKTTLYYTKGKGYFEEFRKNDEFSNFGLSSFTDNQGMVINFSDIVRRRWLDNDLLGLLIDTEFLLNKKWTIQSGIAWNNYSGDHFGNVIKSSIELPHFDISRKYYENEGNKKDMSGNIRAIHMLSEKISLHADLQLRRVNYAIDGIDNDLRSIGVKYENLFFNPKFGIHYHVKENQNFYISIAVANKEPSRGDFIDNAGLSIPQSEALQNLEMGYNFRRKQTSIESNFYYMKYKNQLVQTGELNDVGASIRQNVSDSYRFGWEGNISQQISKKLAVNANLTISKNKISSFNEVLFDYTEDYKKITILHTNTDISFSPSIISSVQMLFKISKRIEAEVSSKYVGRQYLDNTSNNLRKLDPYHYENLRMSWSVPSKYCKKAVITMMINNVLNVKYSSNGYSYSYIYGDLITENFLYPQAERHFLLGVRVEL